MYVLLFIIVCIITYNTKYYIITYITCMYYLKFLFLNIYRLLILCY